MCPIMTGLALPLGMDVKMLEEKWRGITEDASVRPFQGKLSVERVSQNGPRIEVCI